MKLATGDRVLTPAGTGVVYSVGIRSVCVTLDSGVKAFVFPGHVKVLEGARARKATLATDHECLAAKIGEASVQWMRDAVATVGKGPAFMLDGVVYYLQRASR